MIATFLATGIIQPGEIVDELLTAFRIRFPAFESTPDASVTYWLTDSTRFIETSTFGTDTDLAQMLYAAHNLALAKADAMDLPFGLTQMKSGTLSLSFDKAAHMGGYAATKYGQQLLALLKMKCGGIRVTNAGAVPVCGWRRTSLIGG